MLHALLDLISLEGIYPSLSSGVGIPLQQRVISVLPAGVIAKHADTQSDTKPSNELLLGRILTALFDVIFDVQPSIQPVIRGRILSDLISGASELAFNTQSFSVDERHRYENAFMKIIDEYVALVAEHLQPLMAAEPQPHCSCQHCPASFNPILHHGSSPSSPVNFRGSHYATMVSYERSYSSLLNSPHHWDKKPKPKFPRVPTSPYRRLCKYPDCSHRCLRIWIQRFTSP